MGINGGYFMLTHGFDMELFMCGQGQALDLYVMRGIPGTGKSHRAQRLSERLRNAPIFSADHFYGEGEEYRKNWTPQKAHLGHRDCEAKVLACMKEPWKDKTFPKSIIVDNTNISLQGFRIYLDYALDHGYAVHFVYPDSPWWKETVLPFLLAKKQENMEQDRVKAGEIAKMLCEKTVHGVPEQTISDMLMRFQWVSYDDYFDATQQRVLALERELEEMKGRARKLEKNYL